MINWKAKLTSRKLWMAIVDFVSMFLVAFSVAEDTVTPGGCPDYGWRCLGGVHHC